MSHPDIGQGLQGTGPEEPPVGTHLKQDRPAVPEVGGQSGNGSQQMVANQGSNSHVMKQVPGPSPVPPHSGASPQQQLCTQPQQGAPMPGLHFPNVPTTSQSSRPKTPNRASPRPYHHPLTPTSRPPSTEPSEINLSPERLNASIAGLFPPKINIPLPPRQPNLNRGFDQQGLNPTTLKAIGQAPPSISLSGINNNGGTGGGNTNQHPLSVTAAGPAGAKQEKQPGGQGKRASPSNSRRSSPASSRKSATPSPSRQKVTKVTVPCSSSSSSSSQQQQHLVGAQGQTMLLSPPSVPPSPVSTPSQVSGTMEVQQNPSMFPEGLRESPAEQRPVSQTHGQIPASRDLSCPRITGPTGPTGPQQSKPDLEVQTSKVETRPVQAAPTQDPQGSPAVRAAPTSLNQLLDNTGVPSSTDRDAPEKGSPRTVGHQDRTPHPESSNTAGTTTTLSESQTESRPAVPVLTTGPNLQSSTVLNSSVSTSLSQNPAPGLGVKPSLSVNPSAPLGNSPNAPPGAGGCPASSGQSVAAPAHSTSSNPSTVLAQATAFKPTSGPHPVTGVHSVIQIPASSSPMTPNQITVFVTSNPITTAPAPQAPTSMVSTMVTVPNKNFRPQDVRQQNPAPRPQFIATTPVFINPIFQVPGGSVAPNTSVVSQSVTMVGPIQVSATNIQISPAPSSALSSSGAQPVRSPVGPVQMSLSAAEAGTPKVPQQTNPGVLKPDPQVDTGPPVQQQSPYSTPPGSSPFQPPVSSPPACSSPGVVNSVRKTVMTPSPTAPLRGKPPPATGSSPSSADVVPSPVDRSVSVSVAVAVPPQLPHPTAAPAVQMEVRTPPPPTGGSNKVRAPARSSPASAPGQAAAPTHTLSQGAIPAVATEPGPNKSIFSQAPTATVVGTGTGAPSPSTTLVPAVTAVNSPIPSIVPIVVAPPPGGESANPGGAPPVQSDPPTVAPPAPPPAAPPDDTQITTGKHWVPDQSPSENWCVFSAGQILKY